MQTFEYLQSLLNGINENQLSQNDFGPLHFDRRVAEGSNLALTSQPGLNGKSIAHPLFTKGSPRGALDGDLAAYRHISSATDPDNPQYYVNLKVSEGQQACFKSAHPQDLHRKLRSLFSRGKDGTRYGLLLLTHKNNPQRADLINYFVNDKNQVFFVDTTRQAGEQITQELNMQKYLSEILYLESIPPEGYKLIFNLEPNQEQPAKEVKPLAESVEEKKETFRQVLEKTQKPDAQPEDWVELSKRYDFKDNSKEEFQYLEKGLKIHENNAICLELLSKLYGKKESPLHNPTFYFQTLSRASKVNPKDSYCWIALGQCYLRALGTALNPKNALVCFQNATRVDDKNAKAWNALGNFYNTGEGVTPNPEEAAKHFKRAIAIDGNYHEALHNLSQCYVDLYMRPGNYNEAIKLFKELIAVTPNCPTTWGNLAHCYLNTKKEDDAIQCLKKIIEFSKNNVEAWKELLKCYIQGKGTPPTREDVVECVKKCTELDPKFALTWVELGQCHRLGLGLDVNLEKAFRCYKKSTEVDANDKQAWSYLADCYQHGIGTVPDANKAAICWQRANNQTALPSPIPVTYLAPMPQQYGNSSQPQNQQILPQAGLSNPQISELLSLKDQEIKLIRDQNNNLHKMIALKENEISILKSPGVNSNKPMMR